MDGLWHGCGQSTGHPAAEGEAVWPGSHAVGTAVPSPAPHTSPRAMTTEAMPGQTRCCRNFAQAAEAKAKCKSCRFRGFSICLCQERLLQPVYILRGRVHQIQALTSAAGEAVLRTPLARVGTPGATVLGQEVTAAGCGVRAALDPSALTLGKASMHLLPPTKAPCCPCVPRGCTPALSGFQPINSQAGDACSRERRCLSAR